MFSIPQNFLEYTDSLGNLIKAMQIHASLHKMLHKISESSGSPWSSSIDSQVKRDEKTKKMARTHDLQFIALSGGRRKLSKTEKDIFLSTTKCYSLSANDR